MTKPGASQSVMITLVSSVRRPHAPEGTFCVQSRSSPDHLLAPARMPVGEGRRSGSLPAAWILKSVQTNVLWGRIQHCTETPGPGTRDPPSYLSATAPACQEARATGGPQACACTRTPMSGKRRDGTPASQASERKAKEAHGALAWKGRESSPEISLCSPKRLSVAPSPTVSGSKVRWAEVVIELLRPRPPSTAPGAAARTLPARAPAASQALLSSGKPARAASFPGDLAEPQSPDRGGSRGHPESWVPNAFPGCPPRPVSAPSTVSVPRSGACLSASQL